MYDKILVPVDGSATSTRGLDEAARLAQTLHSKVKLIHIVNELIIDGGQPVTWGYDKLIEGLREGGKRILDDAVAYAKKRGIKEPESQLFEVIGGRAAHVIVDEARRWNADLIVMGTHGTSGFQHLVLGSVTEKVLRRAGCPVLTVPPRAHAASRLPFERVLCAVDFSDASLDAVRSALSLAGQSGSALTLLHVIEWPWGEPPPPHMEELPAAQRAALSEFRRYLEDGARKRLESLIPSSAPFRCEARLRNGKSYVQILDVAAEERADLIVMGVRGRNPVDLAFFGSTTNQVVRQAPCPVLTLR